MATDWSCEIEAYREAARRLSATLPAAFSMPGLTVEQAAYIFSHVSSGARAFGELVGRMEADRGTAAEPLEAARALRQVLDGIALSCARKVHAMQALAAIGKGTPAAS